MKIFTRFTSLISFSNANTILFVLVALFSCNTSFAQYAKDGDLTVTASNTLVNDYSAVTANVNSGDTTITVNDVAGELGGLAAGDLILIYQAQGALINTTNSVSYGEVTNLNGAGTYEYAYVESVAGNDITVCPLTFGYLTAGFTQVVKVPQYDTLTINAGASITPLVWQDAGAFRVGGIVAINAVTIVNNGTIDVSELGFRGGIRDNQTSPQGGTVYTDYISNSDLISAEKGESIAGFGPEYILLGGKYGRGAPANGGGGGNAHNAGGGGGANGNNGNVWFNGAGIMCTTCTGSAAWALDPDYIANGNAVTTSSGGGRGGYTYGRDNENALILAPGDAGWRGDNRDSVGGLGGRPLDANPLQLIFFGGGGGAGDGNNTASNDGGDGAGIILIDAGTISGSGTFLANGQTALNTIPGHNDAPGGGGAGGTIIIESPSISNSLTLSANGGAGGNQLITANESEGPGGGGSGGFIAITNGTPTTTINGGTNGITTSTAVTEFPANGATIGATGQSVSFVGDIVVSCIMANDDDFIGTPIHNGTGGTTNSVFPDDTLNGTTFSNSEAIASVVNNDGLTGLTINSAGVLNVPSGSTPGTYNVVYQICETINSTNCDTAIVVVSVDDLDIDDDGVLDNDDLDDDNDGLVDIDESGGNFPDGDEDGDGIPNWNDNTDNGTGDGSATVYTDTNGDGVPDVYDFNNDGIPNHLDFDSDADGCFDALEGNGGILASQLNVDGSINNPVNDNGIPVGPGTAGAGTSGQADVSSTNPAITGAQCGADLSITKTIDNATPRINETIIFTITLTNSGPFQTTSVQVQDMLPSGLVYDVSNSTIPLGTTYNNVSGIWDLGTEIIADGAIYILEIAAKITPACGDITNNAEIISSNNIDPDSTFNNGN